jgi:hypothetical protein
MKSYFKVLSGIDETNEYVLYLVGSLRLLCFHEQENLHHNEPS